MRLPKSKGKAKLSRERARYLEEFQRNLGHNFQDFSLLNRALTHKSYVNENGEPLADNERLEFLGDAVLELMVSDYFLKRFPDSAEGDLSKLRAAVVRQSYLAKLARQVDLGSYLLLGKGEEQTGGRQKTSILADTLEAVLGAIYLDAGFEGARAAFLKSFEAEISHVAHQKERRDFKSELQEYTQERLGCVPSYRVVRSYGPDHDKIFEVEVGVEEEVRAIGSGKSKKEAEQRAAKAVLEQFPSSSAIPTIEDIGEPGAPGGTRSSPGSQAGRH